MVERYLKMDDHIEEILKLDLGDHLGSATLRLRKSSLGRETVYCRSLG